MDPLQSMFSERPPRETQTGWWVSKSNISDYSLCPWAFWMMDTGQLTREAVLEETPALQGFIDQGMTFEANVRATAVPIPHDEVPTLAEYETSTILGIPPLHNDALGIYGQPDGIAVESGALAPIEVKSHRKPTTLDKMELCFYWELLAPWRIGSSELTVGTQSGESQALTVESPPHGYLLLPDVEGGFRRERIWLDDRHFRQMRQLVSDVREARRKPPQQRICSCVVCSRVLRDSVEESAYGRGDLTLISGIGRKRARALETAGIRSIETLRAAEAEDIVTALQVAKVGVPSEDEAEGWIHHADALHRNEPVVFGDSLFDSTEYIAVDLEYDADPACRSIYLAGATAVKADRQRHTSIWADYGDEADLLEDLANLFAKHPTIPIVTWNGTSADGSQLRKACDDAGVTRLWSEFQNRHIDLYVNLKNSVRFPVAGFDIKSLAKYLGVTSSSSVGGGIDTVNLWRQYCRAPRSKRSTKIRRDLTRYNKQDVTIVVKLAERVAQLASKVEVEAA